MPGISGIPGAPGPQKKQGKDGDKGEPDVKGREVWREQEGKKEMKGHVVMMVHLE